MLRKDTMAISNFWFAILFGCGLTAQAQQKTPPSADKPLILSAAIPLPNWREYPAGTLDGQQVSDVVAWLAAKRPAARQGQ